MEFFQLFANCIAVKGFSRALICDLQRTSYHYIPLGLYEILTEHKGKKISDIKEAYPQEVHETIDEYIAFLEKQDYGFWCSRSELFPALEMKFELPEIINNAIIDIDKDSAHSFEEIFDQLEELGCKFLELRYFDEFKLDSVFSLAIAKMKFNRIRNVKLYLKYYPEIESDFKRVLNTELASVMTSIVVHSSPFYNCSNNDSCIIEYIVDSINSEHHCGNIGSYNFVVNLATFTESHNFNTCLNKKVSIDKRGNLKNCPSFKDSFGTLESTTIREVVADARFKKVWGIRKDNIAICSDCEFRHICTDCRAYVEDANNIFSKPLKCGYDPYTATWSNWSDNPLKKVMAEYYEIKL